MLFLLKKVLGMLLMPLPFICLLCFLGVLAMWRGARRVAVALFVIAGSLLLLLSTPVVSHMLVSSLEHRYAQYDGRPVEFVVVLGGFHRSDAYLPLSSLLSPTSLVRLSEGIRIHRANPGSRLLLSGYHGRDEISQAEAMARVAESLGVAREAMVLYPQARDTAEEAAHWQAYTAGRPTALVTSASHLPRAMSLFAEHGPLPVPAPTEFMSGREVRWYWRDWFPAEWALHNSQRAWHEYVGLAWRDIVARIRLDGREPSDSPKQGISS